MSGCGIIKISENCIYLFGGNFEFGVSKAAIEFDFSEMKANRTQCYLGQNAYFRESLMIKISEEQYASYSLDKENPLILVSGLS